MFKDGVIDRYMHCIVPYFRMNAEVCINSLADVRVGKNVGNYVELTFLEGKLGRFLLIRFSK